MKNVSIYKTTQELSFVSLLDFYLTKHFINCDFS
ncbi:hypothetical protein LCG60_27995 [Bacillus sp. SD-4]|nr:hypothetical protein LCG60_27995 [Bacillus sp. SD-4]